jgi:hypothetical protein
LRFNRLRPSLSARLSAALLALALAGCSVPKVQAWDKQDLAKPAMALDADRLDSRYSEHIYFSREGSGGGWSIGGGGCGCN